jgi:hypothetical protein
VTRAECCASGPEAISTNGSRPKARVKSPRGLPQERRQTGSPQEASWVSVAPSARAKAERFFERSRLR